MNTTLPSLASRANALLEGRFGRYASEVRMLLAKVERRGWVKETAAVRAELARLDEEASLPEEFSTFHDLARLQAGLRRDVTIIRNSAIVRTKRTRHVANPQSFSTILNLSTSSC
jgi:hypothetical protein